MEFDKKIAERTTKPLSYFYEDGIVIEISGKG